MLLEHPSDLTTEEISSAISVNEATMGLSLTHTSIPAFPIPIPLAPPFVFVSAGTGTGYAVTYEVEEGLCIGSITYAEVSMMTGNRLTSLALDNVVGSNATITVSSSPQMASIAFPLLRYIIGNFVSATMPKLTSLSVPQLNFVTGNFSPTSMAFLTSLSAPELEYVIGNCSPTTMALLTTLSFPKLKVVVGAVAPSTMALLTTISYPLLQYIGGAFTIATMASLTSISLSSMVCYCSTIAASTSLGNITDVTLGTVGTLKNIVGATVNISGQKLTAASVNALLALLVSLDGTNGTTLFGSGKTVTINGGTNAAPTGQGATDKTTLQARGATITTN